MVDRKTDSCNVLTSGLMRHSSYKQESLGSLRILCGTRIMNNDYTRKGGKDDGSRYVANSTGCDSG